MIHLLHFEGVRGLGIKSCEDKVGLLSKSTSIPPLGVTVLIMYEHSVWGRRFITYLLFNESNVHIALHCPCFSLAIITGMSSQDTNLSSFAGPYVA